MPLIQFTEDHPKQHGNDKWKKGQRLQVTIERRNELVEKKKVAKEVRRVKAAYKEPPPNFRNTQPDQEEEPDKKSTKQSSPKKTKKKSIKTKN